MKTRDGRWEKFDDYVLDFALDRLRCGERVALVTLAQVDGSSPRPPGAQMAVSRSGEWVGYLSGGCIEHAVVAEALLAMDEGRGRRVRYGKGSRYLDIQLPCGSAIELVFDVAPRADALAEVDARLRRRQAASLEIPCLLDDFPGRTMIRLYRPRRRLVIAGAGPAAVHLARIGALADFEVILHSPDPATRAMVEAEGIATAAIGSIGAVPDFQADDRSAVVFMFHDHEWEQALIPAALSTPAFYIGAMGSRNTHRQRLAMLESLGVDRCLLGRIRGPAGLFSGARSAPDTAMSILAEVMQIERSVNSGLIGFIDGPPAAADGSKA